LQMVLRPTDGHVDAHATPCGVSAKASHR
jgi:hypothetical protein